MDVVITTLVQQYESQSREANETRQVLADCLGQAFVDRLIAVYEELSPKDKSSWPNLGVWLMYADEVFDRDADLNEVRRIAYKHRISMPVAHAATKLFSVKGSAIRFRPDLLGLDVY